ncbi:hypothetical protein BDZ45DRAFT_625 [Acephala macrosclerotiorum]|nr:hypothetical protein BDZ45DRAFT_625 [Acephala macrosclerotiorum]
MEFMLLCLSPLKQLDRSLSSEVGGKLIGAEVSKTLVQERPPATCGELWTRLFMLHNQLGSLREDELKGKSHVIRDAANCLGKCHLRYSLIGVEQCGRQPLFGSYSARLVRFVNSIAIRIQPMVIASRRLSMNFEDFTTGELSTAVPARLNSR